MNISIQRTKAIIRSCNSCYAKNYDGDSSDKKADTLYDVQIGGMVNCLCADCLKQLIESATVAIATEKEEA